MKTPTGYILHRGLVNGHPFVAIATMKTANRKTGDMVQIWFLLTDVHPVDAVASGLDAATICRECPFASGGGCYVNVGQAPAAIWRAYHRNTYPTAYPKDFTEIFRARKVRFGAYGNPTLLPLSIVKAIASASAGWTGYFHDWRTNPLAHGYAAYFMASTETASSHRLASALGFRTFHASPVRPSGAVECLAESKGLECSACKLCSGLAKPGKPSVWINPHGSTVKRATAAALA